MAENRDSYVEDERRARIQSMIQEVRERREAEKMAKITERNDKLIDFLNNCSPMELEAKLGEYVIGQPELVKSVADFVYYHVLSCVYPELPVRNILVAGRSGTGKTEVFRCVKQLFEGILEIKFIDGSRVTQEGWKGNYKIDDQVDNSIDILVIDEVDKMCKPQYSTGGVNASIGVQAQCLKLLEREHLKPGELSNKKMNMSVALVGAFEGIRDKRDKQDNKLSIGFGTVTEPDKKPRLEFTDEDFIEYGVMPEVVGRISIKVTTNDLSDFDYFRIIKNPRGRITKLQDTLSECGVFVNQCITDHEIMELIKTSQNNHTGFRWVSAQVENRILESVRKNGVQIKKPEMREVYPTDSTSISAEKVATDIVRKSETAYFNITEKRRNRYFGT